MKVFLHLPKTGGTTIVHTLSRQILFKKFRRLNPTRFTHPKEFLAKVEELLEDVLTAPQKPEVVGGHFGFGAHPKLKNPTEHFTVLRDPIERVISEYYYMKHKGMYYQEIIETEKLSLIEYINHPEIKYLNNLQTRLIAGESYNSGDTVTEEIYQKALANLKSFSVFGLTEQMGSSLALFYIILGWKRLPYYLQSNANDQRPNRNKITQLERDTIGKREQYDIRLYEEAEKIFSSKVNEHTVTLEKLKKQIMNPSTGYKFYLKILNKVMN